MNTKIRFFLATAALLNIIIFVPLLQLTHGQRLDRSTLKTQLQNQTSIANETDFMLDQYLSGKITSTYLKIQSQHLQKKVDQFYQELEEKSVDPKDSASIKEMETNVFHLSLTLNLISSSTDSRSSLMQVKADLQQTKQNLKDLEKKYE